MRNLSVLLLCFFCSILFSQSAEVSFLKNSNSKSMPIWDKTMEGVSFSVYPAMPITAGSIWAYGYFNDDKEMMRNGYKSAISIGIANGISFGLKKVIQRDRPFVTYPNEIIQRTHVGPLSFPSGHTTAAFASATALTLSTKKWQFAIPAYAYASLVGYSRMRLGVHYPSDVLGGMIVGIGSGLLTWQIDKWIRGSKTP